MKVLMFGWEFPPYSSGGLGTACYGLTKGLAHHNIDVTFVLPSALKDAKTDFVKLVSASDVKVKNIKFKKINSIIKPYMTEETYEEEIKKIMSESNGDVHEEICEEKNENGIVIKNNSKRKAIYGSNLFEEVYRFSQSAAKIAKAEKFDVIHAHDWMTYEAGIKAKRASKKPLVIHVHATEFDRTGGSPNRYVYDIEKEGMKSANKIITVSNFTKNKIVENYGIKPDKIEVVHNAVEFNDNKFNDAKIESNGKMVLFLGRLTIQKGPDYFIEAARKVLEHDPNVKFVVAGTGDMETRMIERAAELGIGDKVLFSGFLSGNDIDKAYQMANLYVMPSISEPFGITPLEAMRNDTPVLISKQSGVSEVIGHCLKVDFWDTDLMADKILGVLKYNDLYDTLKENGKNEVNKFSWNNPAAKCVDVYNLVSGC